MIDSQRIDSNEELDLAWQLVEKTGVNVFLTGKAGTGKTTFLRQLKQRLPKRMVVVAPTGVAAINAEGVTIHSFFQLPLSPFVPGGTVKTDMQRKYQFSKQKKNIIRTLDLLVIDEISMVRSDLLDAVDDVLRRYRDSRLPFGGVQLLMIGDLQQLAPVVKDDEWQMLREYYDTPYFFGSRALQQTRHVTIELQKVYRQTDQQFIDLLNKVRNNCLTQQDVDRLNSRVLTGNLPTDGVIRLSTHNRTADAYNEERMRALPGIPYIFKATVEGTFPETSFPAEKDLALKSGCQVMFLKNDPSSEHNFYNGKLAVVTEISDKKIVVRGLEDNRTVEVPRMDWSNSRYVIDKTTREIREEVEGVFSQYPLRLAWAITIHKSQGLTFEKAVLDVNAAFAAGQVYVALSRCRTLQGLTLTEPLSLHSIITDAHVTNYVNTELQQAKTVGEQIGDLKKEYHLQLLGELFDFLPIRWGFQNLLRIIDEHLYRIYPKLLQRFKETAPLLQSEVCDVAPRFCAQCASIMATSEDYEHDVVLAERIRKACQYFEEKTFGFLNQLLTDAKQLTSDNQKVNEQLQEAFETVRNAYYLKVNLLRFVLLNGFTVATYLKRKATIVLDMEMGRNSAKTESKPRRAASSKTSKKSSSVKPSAAFSSTTKPFSASSSSAVSKPSSASKPSRAASSTVSSRTAARAAAMADQGKENEGDIAYPELFETLRRWRAAQAFKERVPAYTVLTNESLIGIANTLPTRKTELGHIKGMGAQRLSKYGDALLEIVMDYISENAEW